jgi:hypothetical protein
MATPASSTSTVASTWTIAPIIREALYGNEASMRSIIHGATQDIVDIALHAAMYRCNTKTLPALMPIASVEMQNLASRFAVAHICETMSIVDKIKLPLVPEAILECIGEDEDEYAGEFTFCTMDPLDSIEMCKMLLSPTSLDSVAHLIEKTSPEETDHVEMVAKDLRE